LKSVSETLGNQQYLCDMSLTPFERKANDARRWADRDARAASLKARFRAAARWNDPITPMRFIAYATAGTCAGLIAFAVYVLLVRAP
jgi:hypothetical protein